MRRRRKRTYREAGKRRRSSRLGKRFVDLVIGGMLFLAVYFAIVGGEYTVFELRKLEALEQGRAAELARAEAEVDSLRRLAQLLRTDPEAIERAARERYGMIRDGEILYRFHEAPAREDDPIDGPRKPE